MPRGKHIHPKNKSDHHGENKEPGGGDQDQHRLRYLLLLSRGSSTYLLVWVTISREVHRASEAASGEQIRGVLRSRNGLPLVVCVSKPREKRLIAHPFTPLLLRNSRGVFRRRKGQEKRGNWRPISPSSDRSTTGDRSQEDQKLLVKMGEYIRFYVYHRSY